MSRISEGAERRGIPGSQVEVLDRTDAAKEGILVGIRPLGEVQGVNALATGDVELTERGLGKHIVPLTAENRLDACTDCIYAEVHRSISRQRKDFDPLQTGKDCVREGDIAINQEDVIAATPDERDSAADRQGVEEARVRDLNGIAQPATDHGADSRTRGEGSQFNVVCGVIGLEDLDIGNAAEVVIGKRSLSGLGNGEGVGPLPAVNREHAKFRNLDRLIS